MSRRRAQTERLVFLAGAWFALAFSFPALFYWSKIDSSISFFLMFVLLPTVLAFICGEGLGSDILSPRKVQNSKQAGLKGVKVAFLTYLFFTPLCAVALAVYRAMYERNPHEWLTVQFMENLFGGFIYVGFYGFLIFSTLFALVGAVSGWLLFRFRLVRERP